MGGITLPKVRKQGGGITFLDDSNILELNNVIVIYDSFLIL
jgi:hypothetical protein